MFSFKGNSKDLQQIVDKAETARAEGRTADAERLLRQIVQFEPDNEHRAVLAQACLNLAEICDERKEGPQALQFYGKARFLGAMLTERAWAALAEGYADQQATSEYALSAYLAYIERRPPDASSAKVYAALESACRVDEDEIAGDRKRAFELNKRVIAANSELEWPHYYMGVAYLQEGDLPAAMMNLTRARKRNPDRPMTYYWMGACHLRQSGAGLQAAIEWLSKFLAFPADNPHLAELQGSAAFELGKRLMRTAAQGHGDSLFGACRCPGVSQRAAAVPTRAGILRDRQVGLELRGISASVRHPTGLRRSAGVAGAGLPPRVEVRRC